MRVRWDLCINGLPLLGQKSDFENLSLNRFWDDIMYTCMYWFLGDMSYYVYLIYAFVFAYYDFVLTACLCLARRVTLRSCPGCQGRG